MRLLWIPLAALLLAGCAIVPLVPFGYAPPPPRPRYTYSYPVYPAYPYAPRYYDRGRWWYSRRVRRPPPGFRWLLPLLGSLAVLAAPSPDGLSSEGQRVLAVIVLAIGLWGFETLPPGVTAMVGIIALVFTHAVPGIREALVGFADPIAYFLIGVLTLGVAVARSGLAERVAHLLLARGRGRAGALYAHLLLALPLLTLLLPSATTRTGILVHVYDRAFTLGRVPPGAPLARAIMLVLNSVNRLSSTILLTGGITPIVAAGLIGTISWTRWFVLMSVPYLALITLAAAAIYLRYRHGFHADVQVPARPDPRPLSGVEWRTALITAGAGLLWLTDSVHHWHPTLPALLAWVCFLMPGVGVLTWRQFEQEVGWTNFFVLAASLSLAQALSRSGASAWLAWWAPPTRWPSRPGWWWACCSSPPRSCDS